ncbi:MAG: 6-bladed beta-propeller [Thaumarchaeota archaeon]|nr:6-bladed beta-propeller [Nitrososphaerota archaeon]
MKILVPLFLFATLVFVTWQNASAFTIDAVPEKQEFGPNDWIKVDLNIHGYNGGPINWVAHRPDNSVISGTVDQQVRFEKAIHTIIRDAFDKEFGPWSINYQYGGLNQTVHFNVKSLNLVVFMDKVTYYEPDVMNINITSSYFNPKAQFAQSYFLNFYDKNENPIIGRGDIEVTGDKPSVIYHFPIFELSRYNPPGLYKLKIQYFNSVIELPFLLGDIHKLMELSVQSTATYFQGSDVTLDVLFSRITQPTATLKITDPSGNVTTNQFYPRSDHDTLVLKNFSKKIGIYKYEVHYAGATNAGTFNVVKNPHELPNIQVNILPSKLNYRPGEIADFKIQTSQIITNSLSTWVTNPDGKSSLDIMLPIDTSGIIIPHKIAKNDNRGEWKLYVNYDGIVKYSSFYVDGPPVDDNKILDAVQYSVPTFISLINSTTFKSPTNIAADSANNTYLVDAGNSKIEKFDNNGNLLLSWGNAGSSMGQLKNPLGISVDENYVYVVDTGNSRINMYNKTGGFVNSWGTYGDNSGMFRVPSSINLDHNGEIFVGDLEKNAIQIFNNKGTHIDQIDSSLTQGASFLGIKALTFDSQNNLFAVSTDNTILKYSHIGKFLNVYGSIGAEEGRFNNPSAIATDSRDNIYVADTDNHRIQKFDSDGNFILSWGTEGLGVGQFEQPVGLAIDSADNIYVVDKKNNNLQKFALYSGINKNVLPSWVRNSAIWWSEGILDKKDFALAIRYVVNQGIITAPPMSHDEIVKIPNWVKGNVKLWSSGQIDDNTFLMIIEHLMSIGIVKI